MFCGTFTNFGLTKGGFGPPSLSGESNDVGGVATQLTSEGVYAKGDHLVGFVSDSLASDAPHVPDLDAIPAAEFDVEFLLNESAFCTPNHSPWCKAPALSSPGSRTFTIELERNLDGEAFRDPRVSPHVLLGYSNQDSGMNEIENSLGVVLGNSGAHSLASSCWDANELDALSTMDDRLAINAREFVMRKSMAALDENNNFSLGTLLGLSSDGTVADEQDETHTMIPDSVRSGEQNNKLQLPKQWVIQPGTIRATACKDSKCRTCHPRSERQDTSPTHKAGEPPYCEVCQEVFNNREEVEQHVRRIHGANAAGIRAARVTVDGIEKVYCRWPGCKDPYVVPWITNIARHIVDTHIIAPVHCDLCDRWLSNVYSLRAHQRNRCRRPGGGGSVKWKRSRRTDDEDAQPELKKWNIASASNGVEFRTRSAGTYMAARPGKTTSPTRTSARLRSRRD